MPAKRAKRRDSKDLKENPYAGITGKLGHDNLRSNFKLKSQAELHERTSKKQKKLSQATKQLKLMKKEKIKKRQDNVAVRKNILLLFCFFISYLSSYLPYVTCLRISNNVIYIKWMVFLSLPFFCVQAKQKSREIDDAEDANFNKLVDNYRNKVMRLNRKKSKWYESSNKS